ncbi:putative DNA-dependent ATPase RAD55 NDAI_0A03620 [Naumovozyma dairenensis CBS 421]|uniref:RecA family profile 1 domain-containing protein n=1 Tax=Naumovozyma dairenensis (strain ATCC 10597 / BCRC 20456 / CBS 421 / NBRC 0211 / NRRL Y-12639) TaxID=1071378 RepID=G0W3Y1_NAUDC|nr:hypothetical protein NDAI_0A03620 [Naumovozyma dairenensis CBS 421]CCD22519.1 hypothetical protein NDAI_0A03620 [Naumovozyma dairenensis CBS 421]
MSMGISLSQFIVEKQLPLSSGISGLDDLLNGGFQRRSIYEIFGTPGIGKTRFGIQLVDNFLSSDDDNINGQDNGEKSVLWIETHRPISDNFISRNINHNNHTDTKQTTQDENIFKIRITKYTELLYFFRRQLSKKIKEETKDDEDHDDNDTSHIKKRGYELIIIDGFSQIINDHIQILLNRGYQETSIHETKCNHLILLMTWMTKYIHSHNGTIILLNDSMNTSYQQLDLSSMENDFEVIEDGSNFFVKSWFGGMTNQNSKEETLGRNSIPSRSYSESYTHNNNNSTTGNNKRTPLRRNNVQVLKSSLIANSAMGPKDFKWEIFLKKRIGFFWNWLNDTDANTDKKSKFERCRLAIIFDLNNDHDSSNRSSPEPSNTPLSQQRQGLLKRNNRQEPQQGHIDTLKNSFEKCAKFAYCEVTNTFVSVGNSGNNLNIGVKKRRRLDNVNGDYNMLRSLTTTNSITNATTTIPSTLGQITGTCETLKGGNVSNLIPIEVTQQEQEQEQESSQKSNKKLTDNGLEWTTLSEQGNNKGVNICKDPREETTIQIGKGTMVEDDENDIIYDSEA